MTGVFKTDAMTRNLPTRNMTAHSSSFAERKGLAMHRGIARALGSLPRVLARGALALALLPALGDVAIAQKQTAFMQTEHFEIALVHSYTEIWRDSGSRADRDVFILRPQLPPGFRSLGDVAVSGKVEDRGVDKFPYTLAIKPKPGKEHMIARPTGRVQMWSTDGSRANVKIKVFGLTCPTNFIALGGYVQLESDPRPNEDVVCVNRETLTRGTWALRSVWDDKGTGADTDVSFWNAEFRGEQKSPSTLIFPSNALVPSTTHEKPKEMPWVLRLTHTGPNPFKDVDPMQAKTVLPAMNSPEFADMGAALTPIEYKVPFYQVQDPDLTFFEQWMETPVYTIRRTAQFELVAKRDNTANCELGEASTFSYKTTRGTETSIGWNVSINSSVTVEASASFEPFGVGVDASVAVSVGVSAGSEASITYSSTVEEGDEIPVAAGTAVALYKMKSEYSVYRQGSDVPIPNATATHSEMPVWTYYRIPGWTKENNCGRPDRLFQGPMQLEKGKRYPSNSGYHYLLWDDRDFAIYTDAGNPVWKFSDVFDIVPRYNSVAISGDGQITVTGYKFVNDPPSGDDEGSVPVRIRVQPYELVQNPNRPMGTAIHLNEEGVLQVVAPTGRVVWESSGK
jgi:hypothetical protein